MKDYKYFTATELECHCRQCNGEMNDIFMSKLIALRKDCAFPFHIGSAYRCPEHNADVGGGEQSGHLYGRAVDIIVSGRKGHKLIGLAGKHGITGIGIKQHGPYEDRFIHLDDLTNTHDQPRPHLWSYP